ncbi:FGLLP motif-containing membrane protein [Streptomyces sp. BPTC-684]|uniref:FGLLP motif-containing membrane protein n=1 Tax=Streptomyces sp. BPTC-684 TaxID=3043734 RepID=UPI0024B14C93|nr:FGLLP motif-containing membrane protein [Streptomyces sp. BPTC-684]WHM40363.1 FGLLP motif-containing membrane protein [Streptomyces sp. BPTC-684]
MTPVLSVPEKVEQGKLLVVSGSHFDCGTGEGTKAGPLTLTGDLPAPIAVRTDASGRFSQSVKVAEKAPLGVYEVVATCDARPSVTQVASYEVVAAKAVSPPHPTPVLTLSPGSGRPETKVNVSGEGFLCRGPARLLWDGADMPGTGATPAADGKLAASFSVPAGAGAGTYKVTATCEAAPVGARAVVAPAVAAPGVAASQTFTVTQPPITPPPVGTYEITIHMTDYPAICTWGRILVGGKGLLDPWLDADSYKGDAEPGHWRFIDLHGYIPPDMKGHQPVDLDCPGRAVERAGTIDLPAEPFTAFFLPKGSTVEHHAEGSTGVLPKPELPGITPPPPTPSTSGTPEPGPTASDNVRGVPDPEPSPGPSGRTGESKPGGGHSRPAGLVGNMRTPAEVSWALKDIAGSVGMAAWFLLLVLLLEKAFPSQLADNALSRWWRRRHEERAARASAARLPGWVRMGSFALLGGALVVWADATAHWSGPTVAKALGAAVGTLLILVTYEKTKDSLLRPGRGGIPAELRVVPAGLLLAALMAALSRGLAFPVPYVYGLVAVYVVLGTVPPGSRDPRHAMPRGQAVMVGGISVLSASLLVWVLGTPLIEAGRTAGPNSFHHVVAYTVGLTVVGGIEVVVFGMLPLSGMDSHALKSWSKPAWYGLYLLALTLFFHVLLNSVHPGFGPGFVVSKDLRWCTLAIATALFLAAWVFSLGLRSHVARLERRAAAVG